MCNSPCSIVERAAFANSPAWHAIAINNMNNLLSIFLMAKAAILDSQHALPIASAFALGLPLADGQGSG
jgi:hypothetical protein